MMSIEKTSELIKSLREDALRLDDIYLAALADRIERQVYRYERAVYFAKMKERRGM